MNQIGHRGSLGGAPRRLMPHVRLGYAPEGRHTSPQRRTLGATTSGSLPSNYSRVQPSAYLIGGDRGSINPFMAAGLQGGLSALTRHGLGAIGANWLVEGVALAAASTFIDRLLTAPTPADEAEELVRLQQSARQLEDPFANAARAGQSTTIVLGPGQYNPATGLGRLRLGNAAATHGINTAAVITGAAIKSGSSLAMSSTWLAAAGGPIGVAVAGATVALTYLFTRQRPARKVATTEIVNEVEPLLIQNLAGYSNGPRTPESQAQAIANFNAGWDFVKQYCGDPAMGKPGEWCISDRKRGGKWDWFARYYDPIANDTQPQQIAAQRVGDGSGVTPTPTGVQTMVDPQTGQVVQVSSGDGGISGLALVGLALVGGLVLMNQS